MPGDQPGSHCISPCRTDQSVSVLTLDVKPLLRKGDAVIIHTNGKQNVMKQHANSIEQDGGVSSAPSNCGGFRIVMSAGRLVSWSLLWTCIIQSGIKAMSRCSSQLRMRLRILCVSLITRGTRRARLDLVSVETPVENVSHPRECTVW